MKLYKDDMYVFYIALALAIGNAVPLYTNSFNVIGSVSPWLVAYGIPALGNLAAIGIAFTAYHQVPGLNLKKWARRITLLASCLYILLLAGSFFVGTTEYSQWNVVGVFSTPIIVAWYLFVGAITGIIMRMPSTTS